MTFRVFSAQSWGRPDYETYVLAGVTHCEVPVGLLYAGSFENLLPLADDDANEAAQSVFCNVTIKAADDHPSRRGWSIVGEPGSASVTGDV